MKFISTNLLIYSIYIFHFIFILVCSVATRQRRRWHIRIPCAWAMPNLFGGSPSSDGPTADTKCDHSFVDAEFLAFHVLCIRCVWFRFRLQWCVANSLSHPMHDARLAGRQSRHGISLLHKLLRPLKTYDSHLISHGKFSVSCSPHFSRVIFKWFAFI